MSSDDNLRRLMRYIAYGLPLVPALGCAMFGSCPPEAVPISFEQTVDEQVTEVDCEAVCGDGVDLCELTSPGHVTCTSHELQSGSCGAGRRPAGVLSLLASEPSRDPLVDWLRDTAVLEAASVPAFGHLAKELREHGAPEALIEAAQVAKADETRHAHAMARLAARRGGPFRFRFRHTAPAARSLRELAEENAREGCVGEAWGAFEASVQARDADDEDLRAVMHTIAREEAQHALLSLAIDDWARARLSVSDTLRLDDATRDARRAMRSGLLRRTAPTGLGLLGPDEVEAGFSRCFATGSGAA